MPSLKRTSLTETFESLNQVRHQFGERNDCSVKAIAVACGVTYEQALAALTRAGRKPRKGTLCHVSRNAIEALGFRCDNIDPQFFIDQYPGAHNKLQNVTTHHPRRFRKVWARFDFETFIFITSAHMLAVKGGTVHDWSINRALRVQKIWKITEEK